VITGIKLVRFLMPAMASVNQVYDKPMPCLASYFSAKSGVKKLMKIIPVITFTTLACNPSTELFSYLTIVRSNFHENLLYDV